MGSDERSCNTKQITKKIQAKKQNWDKSTLREDDGGVGGKLDDFGFNEEFVSKDLDGFVALLSGLRAKDTQETRNLKPSVISPKKADRYGS